MRSASACGLLVLGLLTGCKADPPVIKPETPPEAKWAKGVADDFWAAFLGGKEEQAAGLMSPDLAKAVVTYERWGGVGGELKDITPGMYLRKYSAGYCNETTVRYEDEDLAPDRSEVVFRGSLGGKDTWGKAVAAHFTMRVARESAGGRWSVRYLLITPEKAKVADGKK